MVAGWLSWFAMVTEILCHFSGQICLLLGQLKERKKHMLLKELADITEPQITEA
jgi:hypothetical protein